MSLIASSLQNRQWQKDEYTISTKSSLIPVKTVNTWFASDQIRWAKETPDGVMRATLQNSLCFGLYKSDRKIERDTASESSSLGDFIGLARCITDYTTFLYLTDVYIPPTHQGRGLGKWLIGCVQEVIDEMPYLRRSMLSTSDWECSVPFYGRLMGMEVIGGEKGQGPAIMQMKGGGFPDMKGR